MYATTPKPKIFRLDGLGFDGFGLGGITRREEPQRRGYEGSPSQL